MKYERMGELGSMFLLGGDGVCGFVDEELAESDDETDNERDL